MKTALPVASTAAAAIAPSETDPLDRILTDFITTHSLDEALTRVLGLLVRAAGAVGAAIAEGNQQERRWIVALRADGQKTSIEELCASADASGAQPRSLSCEVPLICEAVTVGAVFLLLPPSAGEVSSPRPLRSGEVEQILKACGALLHAGGIRRARRAANLEQETALLRYEGMIRDGSIGTCIVDDRLRVVQTNDELSRLFNLAAPAGTLEGEDFHWIAHQWSRITTDPMEFLRQIDASLSGETPINGARMRMIDGRIFLWDYIPIFHRHPQTPAEEVFSGAGEAQAEEQASGCQGHVWFFRDVTEQVRRDQEASLRGLLIEEVDDAIRLCDLDYRVLTWNRSAEVIYGWSRAEAIGQLAHVLLESELPVSPEDRSERLHRTGKWMGLIQQTRKDGRRLLVESRQVLLSDPVTGRPAQILCLDRDVTDLWQSEQELNLNKEWLALAQEAAGVGAFEWDLTAGTMFVTRETALLHGLSAQHRTLDLDELRALIPPDDWEMLRQSVKEASVRGIYAAEYRSISSDGQERYLLARGRLVRNSDGSPARLVGVVVDVTEQRANRAALQATEARCASIIASALDCIITIDAQGRIVELNPAAEATFRLSHEQAVGRPMSDFLIPNPSRRSPEAELDQYLRIGTGKSLGHRIEVTAQRANGEIFPAEISVSVTHSLHGPLFTTILRDISARRQADLEREVTLDALRRSEQRLLEAQTAARIGWWEFDPETGYHTWSLETFHLLGIDPQSGEPDHAEVLHLLNPEDRIGLTHAVNECLTTDHPVHIDLRMPLADGTVRWLAATLRAVFSEGDKSARYLTGTIQDITERKQLESELRASIEAHCRALSRVHEAVRAKSEFLATVSHEVRTPLHAILGNVDLLLGTPLDEEQGAMAEAVQSCAEALLALLNDILDLSRLEAKSREPDVELFSPRRLLREVRSLFALTAEHKGLRLQIQIDPRLPQRLIGDAGKLRQVLLNLIGNAVKFTPQGGIRVRVGGRRGHGGRLLLEILVEDTGIGVPAEKQALIFEPFTQADTFTTRTYGGTGLGLTICRQIATLMGGDIRLTSAPGRGSTFKFTCLVVMPSAETPRAGGQQQRSKTRRQRGISSGRRPTLSAALFSSPSTDPAAIAPIPSLEPLASEARVLVVEDNAISRHLATRMLHSLGVQADVVAGGYEALRYIEARQQAKPDERAYDLILMDCQMPDLDGYATTRELRRYETEAGVTITSPLRVPVVAMTASAVPGEDERCRAAGMDGCLVKPVRPKTLLILLQQFLETPDQETNNSPGEPVSSVEADAVPTVDFATLRLQVGNSATALKTLSALFETEGPKIIVALSDAADSHSCDALRQALHLARGTFGMMSALRAAQITDQIHDLARREVPEEDTSYNTQWQKIGVLIESLREELQRVGAALVAEFGR